MSEPSDLNSSDAEQLSLFGGGQPTGFRVHPRDRATGGCL